ncbi:MAG: type IV conjugative transfer system protein TraL [Trichlorobacter sp.]|jgi:type IV conjugative transfer system protein TraL
METRFPHYLSQPFQVLWFEPDDLAVMTAAFIIAQQFGGWLWLLLILAPAWYRRLKRRHPRGFLRHALYWLGLAPMHGYPPFFSDRFHE